MNLRAAHHPDALAGKQGHLIGPVGVQDEPPGAVEHAGPGALRQPPGERREPRGAGEEGRGVGDVTELIEHDRQLDRRGFQPAELGVGRPELLFRQRPRLGQGLADRLLKQPLVLVELELHARPRFPVVPNENNILHIRQSRSHALLATRYAGRESARWLGWTCEFGRGAG